MTHTQLLSKAIRGRKKSVTQKYKQNINRKENRVRSNLSIIKQKYPYYP